MDYAAGKGTFWFSSSFIYPKHQVKPLSVHIMENQPHCCPNVYKFKVFLSRAQLKSPIKLLCAIISSNL